MEKIKRIDLTEFRNKGFLQEANRLFFHSLGLALEVVMDEKEKNKVKRLGGIWDYRDDPEGMLFAENMIEKKNIDHVKKLKESKIVERLKTGECDMDGIQICKGVKGKAEKK